MSYTLHLIITLSTFRKLCPFFPDSFLLGKMFQNLNVSSPAPVTIVLPSGLIAKYNTLYVCPVSVAIFYIFGYFHTFISFREYPCVLTSSFSVLLKIKLQTWEPTSTALIVVPLSVFLNRIVRSAVPPPEARRPCWWGDQAMALTAAVWSEYLRIGSFECEFHTRSLLSLPPEQSCCSSGDHFSPHISCLCPTSFDMNGWLIRRSLCKIVLSLDPVLRMVEFHAMAPTLFECPGSILTLFILLTSQICTYPLFVPRAKLGPLSDHPTDVQLSVVPRSHSLVTFEFPAFHM